MFGNEAFERLTIENLKCSTGQKKVTKEKLTENSTINQSKSHSTKKRPIEMQSTCSNH